MAGMLRAATGWDISVEDLARLGRDIFDLKRAFNVKLGITREDDGLPSLLLHPLPDGGAEGKVPDLARMLADYYRVRGWAEDGRLTPERMQELGLEAFKR